MFGGGGGPVGRHEGATCRRIADSNGMIRQVDDEILVGGVNQVRRIGSTVVRPAGEHTPSVHRLLRHVSVKGFQHAPTPIARDGAIGTETLTFMPGQVGHHPLPAVFRTDQTLVAAARLLRGYHDATADFVTTDADVWFLPARGPAEVICHGDFAPYNCALDSEGRLSIFDFDTAHPGTRLADLGYAAYRWVPLTAASNDEGLGDLEEQRRRLGLFCDAYGEDDRAAVLGAVAERLGELVNLMRRLANEGHVAFAGHIAAGDDERYLNDIEHIRRNAVGLAR